MDALNTYVTFVTDHCIVLSLSRQLDFTDEQGNEQRLHPHNDTDVQHCEYKHTILPMAWIISKNLEVRRLLIESDLRQGQDFTLEFPLANWIVSCKADRLPNLLLTLLLYFESVA